MIKTDDLSNVFKKATNLIDEVDLKRNFTATQQKVQEDIMKHSIDNEDVKNRTATLMSEIKKINNDTMTTRQKIKDIYSKL